MGKLEISKELTDKISKSLQIKQTDIVDNSANKPIVRKVDSPIKSFNKSKIDSPVKRHMNLQNKIPRLKNFTKSLIKKHSNIASKKLDRLNTSNKLDYMKISKIVFISSIVGGIGITLGIKLGTILFL